MFVTKGPIDPESRLFVGRADELNRMEGWLSDVHCVGAVLGARQTGKTSLLLKLRHTFHAKYSFAFIDLQAVEGATIDECFSYISEEIVEQLSSVIDGEMPAVPKDGRGFQTFLQQYARVCRPVRIIVILDELGALPQTTAIKLANTIRSVFTSRTLKPEYARYVFILAGGTDMLDLTVGRNSPLRNVTETIYLGDLAPAETEQLLWEVFGEAQKDSYPDINRHLHTWTEGHPYWTQLLAAELSDRLYGSTEGSVDGIVAHLIRTEDKNLPHIFHSLQADKALLNMFEAVLEGMPLPFSRTNAAVAKLELIGVVKERAGHCAIRNRIYRRAMEGHQISELRLQRTVLSNLNQQMLGTTDIESLLHLVAVHLHQALQNRAVVIFSRGFHDPGFTATASVGITEPILGKVRFEPGCRLLANLKEVFTPQERDLPDQERLRLQDLKTALIVPILLRSEAIGFLSLGPKFSGEPYDSQEVGFLATVAEQTAVGVDRCRLHLLQQDAERALAIQRNLLPKNTPQIPGYQLSGAWYPARLASGDYYDVLTFGEDKFGLCIGDVVGKGLPAAMLMSNLQAHVRASASQTMAPRDLCERINRLTANNIESGKFITFFYALVDGRSRRISYANAGHNPPILLRGTGEILRLKEGGALLGVFPNCVYRQEETELNAGDRLVLFTDGVSEAQDSSYDEFGEERLIELITKHRGRSALEMQEAVIKAVSDFSRGDLYDDVTVLVMAVS
jgi:hypothetical protein